MDGAAVNVFTLCTYRHKLLCSARCIAVLLLGHIWARACVYIRRLQKEVKASNVGL